MRAMKIFLFSIMALFIIAGIAISTNNALQGERQEFEPLRIVPEWRTLYTPDGCASAEFPCGALTNSTTHMSGQQTLTLEKIYCELPTQKITMSITSVGNPQGSEPLQGEAGMKKLVSLFGDQGFDAISCAVAPPWGEFPEYRAVFENNNENMRLHVRCVFTPWANYYCQVSTDKNRADHPVVTHFVDSFRMRVGPCKPLHLATLHLEGWVKVGSDELKNHRQPGSILPELAYKHPETGEAFTFQEDCATPTSRNLHVHLAGLCDGLLLSGFIPTSFEKASVGGLPAFIFRADLFRLHSQNKVRMICVFGNEATYLLGMFYHSMQTPHQAETLITFRDTPNPIADKAISDFIEKTTPKLGEFQTYAAEKAPKVQDGGPRAENRGGP